MELTGKTVIVTGSSSGIGRVLAVEFGRHKANVVCCARRVKGIEGTAGLIEKEGGSALAIPTDITRREEVQAMVSATLERFGRIDVLFNNAGSFRSIAGVWEVDPTSWWEDVAVNLYGSLLCIREVLPHMMGHDGGVIINMDGGRPVGGTGYACGKAGLMELSRVLVKELKTVGSNVMVFNAGPGLVRTEMTEFQANTDAGRKWIPSTKEYLDAGRARQPEEIARATMKMMAVARLGLSGMSYNPDTDFEKLRTP